MGNKGFKGKSKEYAPKFVLHDLSVLERWIRELCIHAVLSCDYGVLSLKKYCTTMGEDRAMVLYEFILRFEKDFTSIPQSEWKSRIEHVVLDKLDESVVPRDHLSTFQLKWEKFVEEGEENSAIDTHLFEGMLVDLENKLEGTMFAEWKRSAFCAKYIKDTVSLADMVDNYHALYYFGIFLANEYSSENLCFYQDVKSYQKDFTALSSEEQYKIAKFISDMYISEDSPLQVNVPFKMRTLIENQVHENSVTSSIFADAQKNVLRLMGNDSWVRFRNSALWTQFIHSNEPMSTIANIPLSIEDSHKHFQAEFHQFLGHEAVDKVVLSNVGRDYLDKFSRYKNPNDATVNCWHEILLFQKALTGPHELENQARAIYDTYFSSSATNRIHLPPEILSQLEKNVDQNVTVFNASLVYLSKSFSPIYQQFKDTGLYTKYMYTAHPRKS